MGPEGRALQVLLAWTSPSWPVGGYAHSHGLEAEIAAGRVRDAGGLEAWLAAILAHGGPRNDAILLALGMTGDLDALGDIARALAPSSERWRESIDQGTAFAAVAREVHGGTGTPRPLPLAWAEAARGLGVAPADVLRAYLHGTISTLVSAAVRFVPLGAAAGQGVLARLGDAIEAAAAGALEADIEDLGGFVPGADLAAMEHETLETRIFRT